MTTSHIKNKDFYRDKKVLITGHTGFKGTWFTAILHYLGVDSMGYALAPDEGCLYEKIHGEKLIKDRIADVRNKDELQKCVEEFQPDVVFHLAAVAQVKDCYEDPVRAYETNVMGTVNLMEVLRHSKTIKSIVVVTTDKVYENKGDGAIYSEGDILGGTDPYSTSKTCMEHIVRTYWETYLKGNQNVGVATVRASNVLGGGDHVKSRLIPSILHAVEMGEEVGIRNPGQTRPWQSVLDALNGYLTVGRQIYIDPLKFSGAWNIGPGKNGIRPVSWVFEKIRNTYDGLQVKSEKKYEVKESDTLGLDITKSLSALDWEPRLSTDATVEYVVDFFKRTRAGESELDVCMSQIAEFFGK